MARQKKNLLDLLEYYLIKIIILLLALTAGARMLWLELRSFFF